MNPFTVVKIKGCTCSILKCNSHMKNKLNKMPPCILRAWDKSYSNTVDDEAKKELANDFIILLPPPPVPFALPPICCANKPDRGLDN